MGDCLGDWNIVLTKYNFIVEEIKMAIETWFAKDLLKAGMDIQLPQGISNKELEAEIEKRIKQSLNRDGQFWYQLNEDNSIRFIQF